MDRRNIAVCFLGLAALSTGVFLGGICFGSVNIPLLEAIKSLFGSKDANALHSAIVLEFRLPRTVTAAFAGAALAVSGLMMQTVFRNPLADPYLFGISSGASLGVVILLAFTGTQVAGATMFAAFSGSLIAMVMLLIIAGKAQSQQVESMLLRFFGNMYSILSALLSMARATGHFAPGMPLFRG